MNQEQLWVLLSKKLTGEASAEELAELELLISENPEWQYAVQNLEDLWQKQPVYDSAVSEDAFLLHMNRLAEMNITLNEDVPRTKTPVIRLWRSRNWIWAAAALVLAVATYSVIGLQSTKRAASITAVQEFNEVSTRMGSKTRIQLPDGTVVMLNSGSKLTYNKEYGLQQREVTLTGEGFFDVVKMNEKPFLIHTSNINIRVLGTAFNVKAYPEDKHTETSLIRGSIEVTIKNRPDNKIILSPNEKLIVENSMLRTASAAAKTIVPTVSINKLKYDLVDKTLPETQWVENRLVFRDETFEELATRMERWYDVKIEVEGEQLKQTRMNGSFDKETIDQALEALRLMIPFRIEQKDQKIIIHR
ncbi:MAG TPA: FecR family protein [Sediminibacterium sp.]|nr:FecR family protein [Sediminibacterium sp.]